MDPINTALNHFTNMGLSGPEAQALVNQGLTAYNQMQPSKMSYGGRAGYADGGLGSLMQATGGEQQAAGGQMDPQQAIQIIIQLLVDNGVPLEQAKKLAIQMLQIFMQGGEPALNQFADQLEQQEQQAMAGGGIAGLHPRQHYLFGGIGKVFSGIGKAVSGVVKGVANAVKSVVKSDIGKLALLAGGAYLMMNPGVLAGLGGGATTAAALEGTSLAIPTSQAALLESAGLGAAGAGVGGAATTAATLAETANAANLANTSLAIPTSTVGSPVSNLTAADFTGTSLQMPTNVTPGITSLSSTTPPTLSERFMTAIQSPGKTLMDLGQGAYDYVKENKIRTALDVANLAGLYGTYAKTPTPTSLGTGQRKGQVEPYLRASAQRLHPEWTPQQLDQFVQSNLTEYAADGGIMGGFIPPARKAGGIMELDARETGGFIPYGKKERHDDVPAILAKNEFVFTSKAVRNAGGGDIKKGAKKMYALMRKLEGARA